jgi:hypothetical protein
MDTSPWYATPVSHADLERGLRHLRRLATAGGLALVLLGAAAGLTGPVPAAETSFHHGSGGGGRKVSMQRKVNEYEGQHRLSVAIGKGPNVPATPTVATGRDPELPVSPT